MDLSKYDEETQQQIRKLIDIRKKVVDCFVKEAICRESAEPNEMQLSTIQAKKEHFQERARDIAFTLTQKGIENVQHPLDTSKVKAEIHMLGKVGISMDDLIGDKDDGEGINPLMMGINLVEKLLVNMRLDNMKQNKHVVPAQAIQELEIVSRWFENNKPSMDTILEGLCEQFAQMMDEMIENDDSEPGMN